MRILVKKGLLTQERSSEDSNPEQDLRSFIRGKHTPQPAEKTSRDISQVRDKSVLRYQLCCVESRCVVASSSTGFSLCTVNEPQLKPQQV